MSCNDCTKVKPVSTCTDSFVVGTVSNLNASVIVTVTNTVLNTAKQYTVTTSGTGKITITGFKISEFPYTITVALASEPETNLIFTIRDSSIQQNVLCAEFVGTKTGAKRLEPYNSDNTVPLPPSTVSTDDTSDESDYGEENLTDTLNKIKTDAEQTQSDLQGVQSYLSGLQLKKASVTFTFTQINACNVTPLVIATPTAPSKTMLPIAFYYTQEGMGDGFGVDFFITMTNGGNLSKAITASNKDDLTTIIPLEEPSAIDSSAIEPGEEFLLTSNGTGVGTAGTVTITTLYIEI
jgi:hypothetical protein